MNINLATAYGTNCSPPQAPELCSYSSKREGFLLSEVGSIEIAYQVGARALSLNYTLSLNPVEALLKIMKILWLYSVI